MTINYQNTFDFITSLMYLCAPISLLFALTGKVTNSFVSFVRGDRRVNL